MSILYLKALHLIFVVTWFAGLFYIVRLFIYHAEAAKKPEPERSILQRQFIIMERRLWYAITWPSMILATTFGLWNMFNMYGLMIPPYFIVKLCFAGGLIAYHMQCHQWFVIFQKNIIPQTSFPLRVWNEVATIFLVTIVFIVVLKDSLDKFWGILALVLLGAALFAAIWLLARRNKDKR